MLREIKGARRHDKEARRRWFSSARMDLFVWYGSGDDPVGFQLCYDRGGCEHALTWTAPDEFRLERVDDGETRPDRPKATPVLRAADRTDSVQLASLMEREAAGLPPELETLVSEQVARYAGARG